MRCCEYYPIAITNGVNERLYLETDYRTFDLTTLDKEIMELEGAKIELIEEIEKHYAEQASIAQSLK